MKLSNEVLISIESAIKVDIDSFLAEAKANITDALEDKLRDVSKSALAAVVAILEDDNSDEVLERLDAAQRFLVAQSYAVIVTYGIKTSRIVVEMFTRLIVSVAKAVMKVMV